MVYYSLRKQSVIFIVIRTLENQKKAIDLVPTNPPIIVITVHYSSPFTRVHVLPLLDSVSVCL